MNTFKRKALLTAVLAGLGAGVAYATPPPSVAQPTPTIAYPYYTLQAGASAPTLFHEYVAVVNAPQLTSASPAVVRLYLAHLDALARARAADHDAFSLAAAFHFGRQHEGFIRWESNAGPAPSATS